MIKGHLISHSHWDREWYLTRMEFLPRLVRMVDRLLDIVEDTPGFGPFMLDGQTIVLEDYLAVRPFNRQRLERAVQAGKIRIGPWYILPDELLISGESHIRNYLIGSRVAKSFGGCMEMGYLPDSFGHPEQMPQILDGLGLGTTAFWRGTPRHLEKSEFYWLAPDGESRILCVNMPNGYASAACLHRADDETLDRLADMMEVLDEKSATHVVLMMNGSDHLLADEAAPAIVRAFNRREKDKEVVFSTIEDFLEDVQAQLPQDLPTHQGELYSGDKTLLLGGTISSRMYLKQRNHTVQKKMERYLEPFICYEMLAGGRFEFAGYQTQLWKLILENHPHDSICGCSIDPVHDEMMTRFACVEQLEDKLLENTFERLCQPDAPAVADAQLQIFVPTQDGLPHYVETEVDFDLLMRQRQDYKLSTTWELPGELPPLPLGVRAEMPGGEEILCELLAVWPENYIMTYTDDDQPRVYRANRARVALHLPGLPCGVHIVNLYKTKTPASTAPEAAPEEVRNEHFSLCFEPQSASFTLTDLATRRVLEGIHRFVDKGDAGDEYSYSWPDEDWVCSLAPGDVDTVRQAKSGGVSSITVEGTLRLPKSLDAARKRREHETVGCPFTLTARLYPGVKRVDFALELENNALDHRLQVEFPTGCLTDHSRGSSAFSVTQHPIDRPVPEVWQEYPQATSITHGFVSAGDNGWGASLATCGTTEYEAVKDKGQTLLRLTLLRCVGWLSQPGLNTRPMTGGWEMETLGGQCLGRHSFQYSLTYHESDWRQAGAYALADQVLHPPLVQQARYPVTPADNPLSFLSTLPEGVRLSAVKPAEREGSVIVRVFSLRKDTCVWAPRLPSRVCRAFRVDLAERRLEEYTRDAEGAIQARCIPGGILTLELVLG